jgi:transcriptional regulator with XRE-family HTH domain
MSQLATSSSKYLLHHIDEEGVEYFTVISTGRAGMSQSGLARLVGVTQNSVSQLAKKIRSANPTINYLPECLKPFAGKNLRLPGYSDQQGRDILEDGFCAAVVEYYARWSKSKNRQSNVKAKQALEQIQSLGMEFMQERAGELIQNIGMRRFIHKKTGWQPTYNYHVPDNFEQEFVAHEERLTTREFLKHKLNPELKSAIEEWRKANRASLKIYSDTFDAMNQVLQGLKSREIKQNNKLPKSASIRDYFEARPLFDYSGLNRLAANFIRDRNMHPVEAVHEAGKLFLPHGYIPKPVPIVENVYKADKRLRAEKEKRELAAGIQLSLPLGT